MSDEKKSGIWSTLRSFVVQDIPDPKPAVPPTVAIPTAEAPAVSVVAPVPVMDQAARERLESAIAQEAPAGYKEIMDDLATLAEVIPDESSRFRAALKLAAKNGMTLDHILNDVDKCIGILESKGREFEEETNRQINARVHARKSAVTDLDAQIAQRQESIAKLQNEITQLSVERGGHLEAITTETSKISAIKAGFQVAYEAVHQQITGLRNKITTYGKGA